MLNRYLITTLSGIAFFCLAAVSVVSQKGSADQPINVFASFQNVKSDGEHIDGYSIDLWKRGDEILGLISVHRGLIGDPPAGLLTDVRYVAKSGSFSFKSKVTLGLICGENQEWIPTQDVIEFAGFLTPRKLNGVLTFTNEHCPDKCRVKQKISLPLHKDATSLMSSYQEYSAWESFSKIILARRGPKW
jgi:hypothetical protein